MILKELSGKRRILTALLVLATACIQGSPSLAQSDAEFRAQDMMHKKYKDGVSARKAEDYARMGECYHQALAEAKKLKPDNPSKKMYLELMLSDYMYAEDTARKQENFNRAAELVVDQMDILEILGKKDTQTYQVDAEKAAIFYNRAGRPIDAKKYLDMVPKK